MFDIIIIGMGISGITAGIYAKRSNLNVLLLDKSAPGGLLNNIDTISNYPGLSDIKGIDLATNLFDQVKNVGIPYKLEGVTSLEKIDNKFVVTTEKDKYESKNIILATGTRPKFLGLDNEKDLLGRGLSTCAVCDGTFYKGKDVCVVGNGNSALQESLYLSKIVNKIYLLNRRDSFKGEDYLIDKVKNTSNIEILYNVSISSYNEDNGKIESVILSNNEEIKCSGVFIYIGYKANTDLVNKFNITNEEGRVIVDDNMETSIKGLFATGDVNNKLPYQLIKAANDGMLAAMYIDKLGGQE